MNDSTFGMIRRSLTHQGRDRLLRRRTALYCPTHQQIERVTDKYPNGECKLSCGCSAGPLFPTLLPSNVSRSKKKRGDAMSRSVLDDRITIKDYWFAITLIYTGLYDLVSVTPKDRYTDFVLLVPKFDYEDYCKEFYAGELQISDAKAFGRTATEIGKLIRDAKRDGQPYVNPDFRQMLRDESLAS
jgi:hypothetical protein